jgi:hypothetical protein
MYAGNRISFSILLNMQKSNFCDEELLYKDLNNTHILNSKMTEILKGFLITDFAHFIAS